MPTARVFSAKFCGTAATNKIPADSDPQCKSKIHNVFKGQSYWHDQWSMLDIHTQVGYIQQLLARWDSPFMESIKFCSFSFKDCPTWILVKVVKWPQIVCTNVWDVPMVIPYLFLKVLYFAKYCSSQFDLKHGWFYYIY